MIKRPTVGSKGLGFQFPREGMLKRAQGLPGVFLGPGRPISTGEKNNGRGGKVMENL